jgi:4-nitrophenyl phosphatase
LNKRAFLIDLDGTIYAGTRPIPGAADFIRALDRDGTPYLYVTNNSSRTPEAVADQLRTFGIPASPEQVITSSLSTADYIVKQGGGKRVYLIGEDGLRQALVGAGLQLVEEERADYVVQGIDRQFTYRKLELAVMHIQAGASFILTNPDRLLPWETRFVPGAGAISGSIREATQVEPTVIGKPSDIIVRYALQRLSTDREVWMVGDNLLTDIAAGAAAGLSTALVLTGVVSRSNLESQLRSAGLVPSIVCDSLLELLHS